MDIDFEITLDTGDPQIEFTMEVDITAEPPVDLDYGGEDFINP